VREEKKKRGEREKRKRRNHFLSLLQCPGTADQPGREKEKKKKGKKRKKRKGGTDFRSSPISFSSFE